MIYGKIDQQKGEGNMSELIRMDAVIDALTEYRDSSAFGSVVDDCIEIVEALPSVNLHEKLGPMINKQKAIHAICCDGLRLERGGALIVTISTAKQWAIDVIDKVPGALICCKECKKYDTHNHRCKHWNHGVDAMDWCSRGEIDDD